MVFKTRSASNSILSASGIGLSLTKHLLGRGYKVGMCDVNAEAGNTLSADLGDDVVFIKCDVTEYEEQTEAFQQVWNKWGRLDFGKNLFIRVQ